MQEIFIMTLMAHAKCGWSMDLAVGLMKKKFCELYFKNEKEVYVKDSQLSWRERLSK